MSTFISGTVVAMLPVAPVANVSWAHGPEPALFDGSFEMNDIELVK